MSKTRAVASEGFITLKEAQEKVELGGSELKVTRLGIGAWSWGDTSYWNNFEWDGNIFSSIPLPFKCLSRMCPCR